MSEQPQAISKTPSMTNGEHPLSAAARAGYGPLSERGKESWHGNSTPCASCGQLKMREAGPCPHCAQDLGQAMLEKMAKHSGPWFVYDSARPFPGVSLERMASLARRGALQRASIVRGPTTYYQWRFASETPLISRYLGRCWNCQHKVGDAEEHCQECNVPLDGHYRRDQLLEQPQPNPEEDCSTAAVSAELVELGQVLSKSRVLLEPNHAKRKTDKRLGLAPLIFFGVAVLVVLAIVFWHESGQHSTQSAHPTAESLGERQTRVDHIPMPIDFA